MPDQVKILSQTRGYSGYNKLDVFHLQHERFAGGLGPTISRELIERGNAVAIVPYDPVRDELVMIEQFRIGAFGAGDHPWLIEFPAGRIDAGETAEDVARRECLEEIGRPVSELVKLCSYLNNPASSTEKLTTFCGRVDAADAAGVHGLAHEGEDIRVFTVPAAEALGWLERDDITNGTTLIGMQAFALRREELRRAWLGEE